MTKTAIILLVAFLLAFAAGTAVGLWSAKPAPPGEPRSWLDNELKLTPEQKEQMKAIWSDNMGLVFQAQGQKRTAIAQERDQAIQALLTAEQKLQYEQIQQEFSRKSEELGQERKKAFDEAVERTKAILTPEQAKQYDELMKRQRDRGPGGMPPPGGPRGPRRHHTASSSRPANAGPPPPHGEE